MNREGVTGFVTPSFWIRNQFDPVPVLLNLWGVPVRFTDGQPVAAPDPGQIPFPEDEGGNGQ